MTKKLTFALRVITELCDHHGMEVCIGQLEPQEIDVIFQYIKNKVYFDSEYFVSYYNHNSFYHKTGILLYECNFFENEFNDPEQKSSSVFNGIDFSSINYDHKSIVQLENYELSIPKDGIYLISFRNESIYLNAKGDVNNNWLGPLKINIDDLPIIDCGILHSVSAADKEWERNNEEEEGSGEIFGIHQFLSINGNVIFYAAEKQEYPISDFTQSYLVLTPDYDNLELILNKFNCIN